MKPQLENHHIARITWNSTGWRMPSVEAGKLEHGTYAAKNGYGHEDWLFRDEWQIDGWRYAFIQAQNLTAKDRGLHPINLTLFAIDPNKRRRLIATIHDLEILNPNQAKEALNAFRENGWLKAMRDDVKTIGGDVKPLKNPKPNHILNIRYRRSQLVPYPPDTFLPDNDWSRNRNRYKLYAFDESVREQIGKTIRRRKSAKYDPAAKTLFRKGTQSIEYTPEHQIMQAKLLTELRQEYGNKHVRHEEDFVDVIMDNGKERIFFEIKSDLTTRTVIRQALGQLMEYAYHPSRIGRMPDFLVIVGRSPLEDADKVYLDKLKTDFGLPLSYRTLPI